MSTDAPDCPIHAADDAIAALAALPPLPPPGLCAACRRRVFDQGRTVLAERLSRSA